jgi:hypothetical protein
MKRESTRPRKFKYLVEIYIDLARVLLCVWALRIPFIAQDAWISGVLAFVGALWLINAILDAHLHNIDR